MLVNFCAVYVYKRLYAKVIVLNSEVSLRKLFKLSQNLVEFFIIAQVKMCIQQVMVTL